MGSDWASRQLPVARPSPPPRLNSTTSREGTGDAGFVGWDKVGQIVPPYNNPVAGVGSFNFFPVPGLPPRTGKDYSLPPTAPPRMRIAPGPPFGAQRFLFPLVSRGAWRGFGLGVPAAAGRPAQLPA